MIIVVFALALLALRFFYSLAEVCFERDWPRHTWRGLAIALGLVIMSLSAFGQNVYYGTIANTTTGTGQMVPMLALPGAYVNFWSGCTSLPCVTPATTYQSAAGPACSSSAAQVVWQPPVGSGCHATADSQGNFGSWFVAGSYQYTITVSGHTTGPYNFTIGGGGGSGGPSVAATSPILVNGGTGPISSGTATISCPTCNTGSGTAQKWPILSWTGLQTINYQTFASVMVAPATGTVPSGCTGSASDTYPSSYNGGAVTYPTATGSVALGVWDLNTNTQLCTITTSASGHAGVPSGSGGTINAGDQIVVTGAATPDASYQNFDVTLAVNTAGGGGGGAVSSLTTTGTGGASTLIGGVLNIPIYQTALSYTPAHSGANSDITSLSGLTTPLSVAQGGSGTVTPALVAGANITISGSWPNQTVTGSFTGATAFSALTSSTNTTAAMVVGSGASIAPSGTGAIQATNITGTLQAGSNVAISGAGTTASPYSISSSGTGTVQTGSGYAIPAYGSASSTIVGPSNIVTDVTGNNLTVPGTVALSGSTHGVTIPAGTATSGAANKVIYASDATNGYAEVNENNTGLSRICTAGNSICAGSSGAYTNVTSSVSWTNCTTTGNVCATTGSVASVTAASLNTACTGNRLHFDLVPISANSSQYVYGVQFNSDTGSHYYWNGSSSGNSTYLRLGTIGGNTYAGFTAIDIYNFGSSLAKNAWGSTTSTNTGGAAAFFFGGSWIDTTVGSTPAITSVTFLDPGNNTASGSTFIAYCVN